MVSMAEHKHDYPGLWKEAVISIQRSLSDQEFSTWFSRVSFDHEHNGTIMLSVPSKFVMDQIKQRYTNTIENAITEVSNDSVPFSFVIKKAPQAAESSQEDASSHQPYSRTSNQRKNNTAQQRSDLNRDYSFESFIVGDNSSFAFNACMAIAKNPGTAYNPCLIYGGSRDLARRT